MPHNTESGRPSASAYDRDRGSSRNHPFGWIAEEAVDYAREQVARLIGADPKEIIKGALEDLKAEVDKPQPDISWIKNLDNDLEDEINK